MARRLLVLSASLRILARREACCACSTCERKRLQVEHAQHASRRAKILKLADKTSNLRAIAASPPPDWSVRRRLDYVEWAKSVAAGLTGVCPWLEREFEAAAKEAERSTVFQ